MTDDTTARVQRIARLFAAYAMCNTTAFRVVVAGYPSGSRRGGVQVHRDAVPRENDDLADASGLVVYRHTDAPHGVAPGWVTSFVCGRFTGDVTDEEALATLERDLRDATKRQAAHFRDIAAQRTRYAEAMERALATGAEETNR